MPRIQIYPRIAHRSNPREATLYGAFSVNFVGGEICTCCNGQAVHVVLVIFLRSFIYARPSRLLFPYCTINAVRPPFHFIPKG